MYFFAFFYNVQLLLTYPIAKNKCINPCFIKHSLIYKLLGKYVMLMVWRETKRSQINSVPLKCFHEKKNVSMEDVLKL